MAKQVQGGRGNESAPSPPLSFAFLGPLEVRRGPMVIELSGRRQRVLLARLLVARNETVSADQLMHELWGDKVRPGSPATLQAYISELRKVLTPEEALPRPGMRTSVILTRPAGYQLSVEEDRLDAGRFEQTVCRVRDAREPQHPEEVSRLLGTALREWRGPALGDVMEFAAIDTTFRAVAARLDTLRLWAIEERIEADLALGSHGHLATELSSLCADYPMHERFWGQLMLALYRSGRQAEALRAYQALRANLDEELGILPSGPLRDLEEAILLQRSELDWMPAVPMTLSTTSGGEAGPGRASIDHARIDHARIDLAGIERDGIERDGIERDGIEARTRHAPVLHHFPAAVTSFVGREREMAGLAILLGESRMVTIASAGGCGKTRLVVEVARRLDDRWPAGVWFVDLAEVTDPAVVPAVLAASLDVHVHKAALALEALGEAIADNDLLLVIDNCEQVVDVVAATATTLLGRCPSLQILCTSREELRVRGERVWRLDALGLPARSEEGHFDLVECGGSDAVRLFVDRARQVRPDFSLATDNAGSVAGICHKLEGIPLAIELAAPLLGVLSPGELDDRLNDRFRLLARGSRGLRAHQRTLRAAIDWSYELLDATERLLFSRLSVFVVPFTLSAAEAVASGKNPNSHEAVDRGEVIEVLDRLVVKSMVTIVRHDEGPTRYRLLETLRLYALERLRNSGDEPQTRERHMHHFLAFGEEANHGAHSREVRTWLPLVEAELANFRAAIDWAFVNDDLEHALRLAGALRWYFSRLGFLEEGLSWIEPILERRDELSPELRTLALTSASTIAFLLGRHAMTVELGEEGLAAARGLDDPRELSIALIVRGAAAVFEGNVDRAIACFVEGTGLCERLGDAWGMAWCQSFWGVGARRMGDLDQAMSLLEPAIEAFREMGDEQAQVLPLANLGQAWLLKGDGIRATELTTEARRLAYRVGDQILLGTALVFLGRVTRAVDGPSSARPILLEGLAACREAENHVVSAIGVQELAAVALAEGRPVDVVTLAGRAKELHRVSHGAATSLEEAELASILADARACLTDEEYQAALDRGARIDLVDVAAMFPSA